MFLPTYKFIFDLFVSENFEHKYILIMAERAHTKMVLGFDIFDEDIDFGDDLTPESMFLITKI